MRQETANALSEIESTPLFVGVGERLGEQYIHVQSWEEAAMYAAEEVFDDYLLELANALTEALCIAAPERYNATWNEIVLEVRPRVETAVGCALDERPVPHRYVKPVADTAGWCLLKYCMECEYSDVVQVDHFHRLWQIFKAGHLPCGIRYVRDELTLVVF